MAQPLTASIPPFLDLTSDFVIQFTALDSATGAVVSGVTVSNATLLVENVTGGDLTPTVPGEEPLWLDLPLNVFEDSSG